MANVGKNKGHRQGLSFDLSKPIKQGTLMKQGALHKAFKYRFFVLYPGFLVYFENESKWRLDVSRGDTLQSRQGAIKLKNGSCNVAKQAPKGCKFGLIVHAPDPQNKRPTYLLNAASKEDREVWIKAIQGGTPHSPKPGRKNEQAQKPKTTEEPPVRAPKYTERQETVDIAAKIASEESSNNPEESITSIDDELRSSEPEPSLSVRRDTSNSAALSITSIEKSNIDSVLEEEEPVISIDDALGPSDSDNSSEADILDGDKLNDLDDEDGENKSPESLGSEIMVTEENFSESMNGKGDTEVVTSVSVVCNGEGSKVGGNERQEETPASNETTSDSPVNTAGEEQATLNSKERTDTPPEEPAERSKSTELVIPAVDERQTNSFAINSADPNGVLSDTDNEEGDGSSIEGSLSSIEPESPVGSKSPVTTPTPVITVERSVSVGVKENGEIKENGKVLENGGVKENGEVKGKEEVKQNGSVPEKLTPNPAARRPSAAFIQKVGYLYKMGGNRKNWKLRYFVLNPGVFFYYKNPKSTKPLGEVKLKNTGVFFPGSGERKTSFQFRVHTESQWNKRQDWNIAAQSEREMKEWMEAFKAAGHKSSPTASPAGSLSNSPTGSDIELS